MRKMAEILAPEFVAPVRKVPHGSTEHPCFCDECLTIGQHYADRVKQRKLDEL